MKWYREPLFHFLGIGALLFMVFSVVNDETDQVESNRIEVTVGDIERLRQGWIKQWNRPPSESELEKLVNAYIKEEVYYREALALGLDRQDTIIRRRLKQKMEFLSSDIAELDAPDEAELKKYFLAHKDKYARSARVSFTHVYFNPEKRGVNRALEDAGKVLSELESASVDILSTAKRGDRFLLQYDFSAKTPFEVARDFGDAFAGRIFKLDPGAWQGPIESAYGIHLVRISKKIESQMPELASVIEKVRTDAMYEHRQAMNNAIYERFKAAYEIVIENMPKQSDMAEVEGSGKERS